MNEQHNGGQFFFYRSPLSRDVLWIASIAVLYFAAAQLGLSIVLQPEGIAPVWLPEGIFLSAILLTRRSARPLLVGVLCVTDFIAELLAGTQFLVSAIYALMLTGDAVMSSWLLIRFVGEPVEFRKAREVIGFFALAVILSNGLAALAAASASTIIPGTFFWNSWKEWVISDGIGNLLVTPFILSWAPSAKTGLGVWNSKRVLEGAVLFVLLALLNFVTFRYLSESGLFSLLLAYSTFPFLLWAALRFGIRGVTLALVILGAIVISFAAADRLPHLFFFGSPLSDIIVVQLYLAIILIPSLFLGAVVTERKQAEETLRERNRYIETILENAPIGFAVNTIHDGKGVFVGGRFEDVYGVPRGSINSVDEYFEAVYRDPVFREEIRARIMADMATGEAARMRWEDIPVTTAAGEKRFVTAINIPLLDQNLMVSTAQDVTARHRAEASLRESEERFRSLVEQAGDGFELLDEEGRYVDVNSATCRQLGYSREELLRLSIPDVDPLVSRGKYVATFQSLVGRPSITFETVHRRKDGTTFPVEITTSIIRLDGVPRALTLVRDITERKRAEEERKKLQAQLMQAQKLESVGQLAGGIAHDFNNILSAIVGYGGLLRMKMLRNDPLRTYTEQILAAAERAASLTQSLLAFSRKQVIRPENVDLNASVQNVEKFLSRIIGEDVSLTMSLCPGPLTIFADATQIEQVLMNLAANARDAMPKGGSLIIATEQADNPKLPNTDNPPASGSYAVLSVTDTGTGMDERTRAKIFEPFFTTKELGRGTGLGLAIVYGVVKQNRGYINVYSETGKGTTFRIYFPLVDAGAEERHDTAAPAPIRGGTETILLVEDDTAIRELSRQVLSEYGYDVIEAEDGDAALQKFLDHAGAIHLIITDVIMPKRSGRDLYEEARKRRPDIKVLFMSGYPADLIEKEGILNKELHFITKPSSPEVFLQKVRHVLDQPAV